MLNYKKVFFTCLGCFKFVVILFGMISPYSRLPALTDFDGDGKDDIGLYYSATGAWYGIGSTDGQVRWSWGGVYCRPVLGDFDGDGKMDPAYYNFKTSEFVIFQTGNSEVRREKLGVPGMFPIPADYDGDGITDLAVFERETGRWIIRGTNPRQQISFYFGWAATRPVPADYDGDGKVDPAIYHRLSGKWFIMGSQDGLMVKQLGYALTRPVVGDYDGDGKADIAVYHTKSSVWTIYYSSGGGRRVKWGIPTMRPVPADYDGDGKTDIATYQRSTGRWYILESATNTARNEFFGWPGASALQSYQNGGIEGGVVLCFGDSITYGRGSSSNGPATGYPQYLQERLSPALGGMFDVVNAGVPGETTVGGLNRFASVFRAVRPELVLLMEGTNDQYYSIPFSTSLNNIQRMANYTESMGANVLVSKIAPVRENGFPFSRQMQASRVRTFNTYLDQYFSSISALVVPVYESLYYHPYWDQGVMDGGSANHPNDLGYEVIANTFLNMIRNAIVQGRHL